MSNEFDFDTKNGWTHYADAASQEQMDVLAARYMDFLSHAKTERETVDLVVEALKAAGFSEDFKTDLVFRTYRGKAVFVARKGKKPLASGVRLISAHTDAPRLDFKQRPLQEQVGIGQAKTHYYGGIRKYQWLARPLALHGVIIKEDGTSIKVVLGEDPGDPVFTIADLLPHLAPQQMKRPATEIVRGEELNLLVGSMPFNKDEESEQVKLNILNILHEKYGMTETDFLSAELEAVPAFPVRELGFDRSMIGGYGHDDRVCAYPALRALLDCETPVHTAVTILTDKEETGSDGNTGLCSSYLPYFLEDLADCFGAKGRHVMHASQCLSADVNAAFDPTFPDVMEQKNCAYLNHGVCVTKFTGARGGGTVAAYIANLDIDTIDVGVPVLSMHAPFEVVSKLDVYMTYRAFCTFIAS